jgi:peptidylprolyl isomerase
MNLFKKFLSQSTNAGLSPRRSFALFTGLAILALTVGGCTKQEAPATASTPPATVSAPAPTLPAPAPAAASAPSASGNIIVTLETNQGTIKLKLFPDVAPKTCENFVGLVQKGYYDGLIFHRVIPDFMIQGGDPTGTGGGGTSIWGKVFDNEVRADTKFDAKGKLAMANAGPNTNGSQFFITTAAYPSLNMHYSLFGEVISGQDVVDKIDHVRTDQGDRPLEKQYIIHATVTKD